MPLNGLLRLHIPSFPSFGLFREHPSSVWAAASHSCRCASSFPCHEDLRHVVVTVEVGRSPGPVWRHLGIFEIIDVDWRYSYICSDHGGHRSRFVFCVALGWTRKTMRFFFGGGSGVRSLPWRRTMYTWFQPADLFNQLWQALWSVTHTDTNRNALCLVFIGVFKGSMARLFIVGWYCVCVDLLRLLIFTSFNTAIKMPLLIAKVWDSYARQVRCLILFEFPEEEPLEGKPNLNTESFISIRWSELYDNIIAITTWTCYA